MKKQSKERTLLVSAFAASRSFKGKENPTTKDVLAAHMMTALQVWAFSKK